MTPSKTERELEELLRAATPLPWWSRDDGVYGPDGDGVAEVFGNAAHLVHAEGNGALIVAAVNALPDLLAERKRLMEALVEYGDHLSDCAHIQPAVEPWKSVPCTCSPEKWWGDHEVGCPRAAAFREWAESYTAPDCTCGFSLLAEQETTDDMV